MTTAGGGRRVEVLLDRQLALAIENNAVVRAIHVSTVRSGYGTPTGSFSVFRKEARSWSVPFSVWLPWASYVVGGIAFHEYPDVPVVPALARVHSHAALRREVAVRLHAGRDAGFDRGPLVRAVCAVLLALVPVGAAAAAPAPPTVAPGVLTVGLNLPSQGFQTGAVRASRGVVAARGFEIDLARAIASRLGLERVRFVNEPSFQRLVGRGSKPWDVGLAEVTITSARRRVVDPSTAYLRADQGVLERKGLSPPTTLGELAHLRLCVQRGTTGADVVARRVRPTIAPYRFASVDLLFEAVRNGRCLAAVLDAPVLAAERAGAPYRYGPLAGVIATGEQYDVVMRKGSPLTPRVNAALRTLTANGTIGALSRRSLTADLAKLPVLR